MIFRLPLIGVVKKLNGTSIIIGRRDNRYVLADYMKYSLMSYGISTRHKRRLIGATSLAIIASVNCFNNLMPRQDAN